MFALIKRVGEKDENLASSFYSVLLSTNTGMLLFVLRYVVPIGFFLQFPHNLLLKMFFISILITWNYICKKYFLKKENHLKIVAFYEIKYEGRNMQMALIGIVYSLFTFSSFIGLAMWLSRM